jgi:hypothetical protein
MQMFVLPVRPGLELPAEFVEAARLVAGSPEGAWQGDEVRDAESPVSYVEIAAHRERWVATWTEAILR